MVTPFEITPALDFFKSLKNSQEEWAPTSSTSIFDLMQQVSTDGWEPALTAITMIGDRKGAMSQNNVKQPKSLGEYKYEGLAAFQDDRLIGYMNENESKSYSYIRNSVNSTVARLDCPASDKGITVQVMKAHSKIVPSIRNGQPYAQVRMRLEVAVAQNDCDDLDLTKPETYREIERQGVKETRLVVGGGLRQVQEKYGTDIYGFGAAFHRKYPKHWKQWKDNWNKMFREMPVDIAVDYKVRKTGEILNSVKPATPEGK